MVKVDVKGCCGFVDEARYSAYVDKALAAFDVLVAGNGAGNDFLGWKHLPSETPESLIADCEAVRDCWKAKGVDLEGGGAGTAGGPRGGPWWSPSASAGPIWARSAPSRP